MISSIRGEIEYNQSTHPYSSDHPSTNDSVVSEGLDFILSHFEEPIWPRTIFTHTLGIQLLVYNKQEALARFKQANFIDCRINAYPHYNEYHGINRQTPNFIFIDLDRSSFKSDRVLWLAINKTCKNIEVLLSGNPTVLWTGNGVHIYQPVEGLILESESLFSEFARPSQSFLKFASQHLSNHKSDLSNNPSFRSCLLRIPGSHNFKCFQRNNSIQDKNTEVKIVQRWNCARPKINPLLYDFYIWLANREIKNISKVLNIKSEKRRQRSYCFSNGNIIPWIERLLQTPIDDYRKNAISLIIAPYLIKVRRLYPQNAAEVIKRWLDACNSVRRIDGNFESYIVHALNRTNRASYKPMRFEKLKEHNRHLYNMLLYQ